MHTEARAVSVFKTLWQMNLAFGTVNVKWRDKQFDDTVSWQLCALRQAGIDSGKFTTESKEWDEIRNSVHILSNQFYQHMLRQADDEPLQTSLNNFYTTVLSPHPQKYQLFLTSTGNIAHFMLRFRDDLLVNLQFQVFPEEQPPNIGLFIVDIDGPAPSPLEFTSRAARAGLTCTDSFLAIVQQIIDTCKLKSLQEIQFGNDVIMRIGNAMDDDRSNCGYTYYRLICKPLLMMDVIFRVGACTPQWPRTFGPLKLVDTVNSTGVTNKWYAYELLPSARSLDCQLEHALQIWSRLDAAQKEKFATIVPYL